MSTETFFALHGSFVNFCGSFGGACCFYNDSRKTMKLYTTKKSRRSALASGSVMILQCLFSVFRVVQLWLKNDSDYFNFNICYSVSLIFVSSITGQLIMMFRNQELMLGANHTHEHGVYLKST